MMDQQETSAAGDQGTDREEEQIQRCPLFELGWADPQRLWDELKAKEAKYQHSIIIFRQHPDLDPTKRAVLLSWLAEVCEVYKLRRETYYLTVEFVDRFLLYSTHIRISELQLTGVTALMLASKMEEVSPPKGSELAYVTDGACSWNEVRAFEFYMSGTLSWMFAPPTLNTWLQLYLQIAAVQHSLLERTGGPLRLPTLHPGPHSHYNHPEGTGELLNLPTLHPGPDSHSTSHSDVLALVEHTKTVGLAKTGGFKGSVGGHSGGQVAGRSTDEVGKSAAGEGFDDSGHCEGTEDKENKMGDDHSNNAAAVQTCVEVEMCSIHQKRTEDSVFREKTNLFDVCQEKREDSMSEMTAREAGVDRKDHQESMLGSLKRTNVTNGEETKGTPGESWTTHLDGSSKKVRDTDANVEADMDDTGFEDDEMDFDPSEDQAEEEDGTNILNPLYSQRDYVKTSQLLDLVVLDSNSLRFEYSVLAAAVLFHSLHCDNDNVCQLTGLTREELNPCIEWMKIHKMVMEKSEMGDSWGVCSADDGDDSSHTRQSFFVSKSMWRIAMNWSDLYFTSEHERMAVMDRVRQEYASSEGVHGL